MKYIIPALPIIMGFLLDCLVGDPYNLPHPIRFIGKLISKMEKTIRNHIKKQRLGGIILALLVTSISTIIPFIFLFICYKINIIIGVAAETILCCYMLAAKCLYKESMKVYTASKAENTDEARKAVSMIVGRDTDSLDNDAIIRAAVETVAENTSDGVTAPLLYMGLGGAVGAFFYKSVNTMDSMIGYKNDKYKDFGMFAAKFDDVLNYIPSRLTAIFMIISASFLKLDGKNAFRIWKRDRRNHASPNSAQTESVCAGALHLRLAGDAWYFGKLHKKPYIGDDDRKIEPEDIKRSNKLMYISSLFMLLLSSLIRCIIGGLL